MYLALEEDFEIACRKVQKETKEAKTSLRPAGSYFLTKFYTYFLPHFQIMKYVRGIGSKHSIVLSNVPGYVRPVYYGGAVAKRFFSLVSGLGDLATSISVVSTCDNVTIAISSDEYQIEDIDLFLTYFDK